MRRAGRPSSVDYYLNHSLDMFLELTRNVRFLKQHFKRFQFGGPYNGKRFVVLDIELRKTGHPETIAKERPQIHICGTKAQK